MPDLRAGPTVAVMPKMSCNARLTLACLATLCAAAGQDLYNPRE